MAPGVCHFTASFYLCVLLLTCCCKTYMSKSSLNAVSFLWRTHFFNFCIWLHHSNMVSFSLTFPLSRPYLWFIFCIGLLLIPLFWKQSRFITVNNKLMVKTKISLCSKTVVCCLLFPGHTIKLQDLSLVILEKNETKQWFKNTLCTTNIVL